MKVSLLLFVGFLGLVSAVAVESEGGAEDDWFIEYNDTEYWGSAPNADGKEYAVPFEYGADMEYEGLAPNADRIGLRYGEFTDDTAPDYGQFKSHADNELEPRNNSGWFMPAVDGSFYWMSKEQLNIHRQTIVQQMDADLQLATFYLYHDVNGTHADNLILDDQIGLSKSKFSANRLTVFLIYGWDMTCNSDFVKTVRTGLFRRRSYNVFCVGWSEYSGNVYETVIESVKPVGKYVARFIDFLNKYGGMSFKELLVVGYDLGAHIAGHAGKNVKNERIVYMVGLDPSYPGFDFDNCAERLCSTDATYVASIQTGGGDWYQLGFNKPLGSITFYPDGGKHQPPCFGDGGVHCSHAFSYKYYATALHDDCFCSIKCTDYEKAQARDCGWENSGMKMGILTKYNKPGIYFVPIKYKYPYGECRELGEVIKN